MTAKKFDFSLADSQGTDIRPILPEQFDINGYQAYEAGLLEKNSRFWAGKSGVAVYRRFRVPQVFSYGCRDMEYSLGLQLAALGESMKYKSDIANFLEPWYGIGTIAGAFGAEYIWHENQAPATKAPFASLNEALTFEYSPVEKTVIGRHILNMVEYFMDKTKGKIPISLTDVQSPLNNAGYLLEINSLFLEMVDDPEAYQKLLGILSDLLIDFSKRQAFMIGNALVSPGHGFASSRSFAGIGLSDDTMLMVSDDMYEENEIPFREKIGAEFGGTVFHSCGNWARKIPVVKKIKNLIMADGAFSAETDPDPNSAGPFAEGFKDTGIVLNARIVGDVDTITQTVKKLWSPGMRLIVVTYCRTPQEQEQAYEVIHDICGC